MASSSPAGGGPAAADDRQAGRPLGATRDRMRRAPPAFPPSPPLVADCEEGPSGGPQGGALRQRPAAPRQQVRLQGARVGAEALAGAGWGGAGSPGLLPGEPAMSACSCHVCVHLPFSSAVAMHMRNPSMPCCRRDPLEDLQREIAVMRRALHPNIVALREVGGGPASVGAAWLQLATLGWPGDPTQVPDRCCPCSPWRTHPNAGGG